MGTGSLAAMYNLQTPMTPGSGLNAAARPSPDDANTPRWWHPDSPLFWLFAVGAVTFGLIGVSLSGSGRVGPFTAGGEVGAGKTESK